MKGHQKQRKRIKPYLAQLYQGNKGLFAVTAAMRVVASFVSLSVAWLMQQIIDTIAGAPGMRTLTEIIIISLLVLAVWMCSEGIYFVMKPRFMQRAIRQYKAMAFERLTRKSMASFSRESSADYISALTNDVTSLENNYLESLFTLIELAIMFFGAFVMMLAYSPMLTAVAVALSILPVFVSVLTGNRLDKIERRVSTCNGSFVAMVKDCLTGFPVIKSFKAEGAAERLFHESSDALEKSKCQRRQVSMAVQAMAQWAGFITQFGVFLVGAYMVFAGRAGITAGVMMMFVQLMNYVITPIAQAPSIFANRKAALALVDKLAAALESNVRDEGETLLPGAIPAIRLEHVTFGYAQGAPVLQDISVCFEQGKRYAVVGASGSGKSTLLNLLMAAHGGYEGRILYGDQELRDISCESLYDAVSMVQQSVFVFNASIRDNITMFSPFPAERVERAISQSGLSALIAERGEDYLCGENGCGLSGGERQRIAIARSLLRGTPVLLVDEATAALDKETAAYVVNALLNLRDLTQIMVTHTLDAEQLARYDSILAMKDGRLVEMGDFQTLMALRGYFYSLYTVAQ